MPCYPLVESIKTKYSLSHITQSKIVFFSMQKWTWHILEYYFYFKTFCPIHAMISFLQKQTLCYLCPLIKQNVGVYFSSKGFDEYKKNIYKILYNMLMHLILLLFLAIVFFFCFLFYFCGSLLLLLNRLRILYIIHIHNNGMSLVLLRLHRLAPPPRPCPVFNPAPVSVPPTEYINTMRIGPPLSFTSYQLCIWYLL